MLIDHTQLYDEIWDWIYETLHFMPNCWDNGHDFPYGPPFEIPFAHQVYGIDNVSEAQLDEMNALAKQALLNAASEGQRIYALEWKSSGFLCDPESIGEFDMIWVEDPRYPPNGGYRAYFPEFYPDGDYYFFIDEHKQFGYLGHPWRKEVWIFGETLLKEFEQIYHKMGWYKL